MTKRRDLGTYQMLWDCAYCDTAKLLALDHRHCPNCGSAQDPERRYFPSDEDKVAVEEHEFVGADWQCASCDSPNAALANFCVNCGSSQEDGQRVMHRADQVAGEGAPDSVEQAQQEARQHRQAQREARQAEYEARRAAAGGKAPKPPKSGGKKTLLWGGVAVIAVILIFIFWKKTAVVTVSGHSWTRSVAIEQLQAVQGSEWCDAMPSAAYNVSRQREKRDTRRVEDGETCRIVQQDQGDGTFKEVEECQPKYREEDVYDQKCYFTIDRWQEVRTEAATGASLAETPRWPEFRLQQTGRRLGAEREGARSERYIVLFRTDDGETHDCSFPEARWRSFAVGQTIEAEVGGVTGNLRCSSL